MFEEVESFNFTLAALLSIEIHYSVVRIKLDMCAQYW